MDNNLHAELQDNISNIEKLISDDHRGKELMLIMLKKLILQYYMKGYRAGFMSCLEFLIEDDDDI